MKTAEPPTHDALAIKGAALAPLSREQKTRILLLARDAWQKQPAKIRETESFDEWRVAQCFTACGRRLSEARNEDFLPLRAHFQNLLGRSDRALNDLIRAQEEPRAWALNSLDRECAKAKAVMTDPYTYAVGFLRRKGTNPDDASPNQIWHAIFTLRRKVQLIRRKESSPANCPF